ncbi:CRISPR-associated endoribonuclease Cas6 [Phaeodactylibacter xiamenensis]|jgi:CRISPR-associated endoribonuclease Cas6|uniref:CRISPR-associated endoribonuclease Cas6 n=1 Tax=Phaeodactylibacter xiamenensis TaxID=1524460 RepID=UPI0024A7B949|nr:CRISPR-associated endoribonuclease Cas6 [Phaeodactylibacter xiamenensis]
MRIYFHLTANTAPVPFNYQPALVGAFHKWLGENALHDEISLYSLSWLEHAQVRRGALDFPGGSTFYISAPSADLLSSLIAGVQEGWHLRWGMEVERVTIQRTPDFGRTHRFMVQSPVLIKRRLEDGKQKYFFPKDAVANQYLTETMQHKLQRAGLPKDIEVSFDSAYENPRTKLVSYKGINIKGTLCPVVVSGDPRAVQFAWEVGVGNSTGIGFGALR